MSEEWKTTLLTARDGGHDLQLHGLTHGDCYEFGPPNWPATAILPSLQTQFDNDREDLLPRYTVNALLARIAEGMEVFHRELGLVPTCFRAPCGAISKAPPWPWPGRGFPITPVAISAPRDTNTCSIAAA
jgi:hypothetical protein